MTVHEIDARLGSENLARPTVHDRLDDLDRMGRDMLAGLGWRDVPEPGGDLARLDAARAAYLNWASGPEGYAAQAGLWFNPPVPVQHAAGGVEVLLVNERIVEQPFAFGALAGLPAGAAIIDVGGSESTVGLSLATLGHRVTVVDPRAASAAPSEPHPRGLPTGRAARSRDAVRRGASCSRPSSTSAWSTTARTPSTSASTSTRSRDCASSSRRAGCSS